MRPVHPYPEGLDGGGERDLTDDRPACKAGRSRFSARFHALPINFNGGGERDRTDDLLRARQALSQLSYTPVKSGGPGRT